MTEQEVLDLFHSIGVIKKGHFRLSSGKHSDTYLQCAILQQYPEHHSRALHSLAEKVSTYQPTVIVGAAVGGIISAYELACLCKTRCIFAERVDGTLKFRRGYELAPDDRVVLIEDVVTTAKTTLELVELIKSHGLEPLAVTALVDRQKADTSPFSYPFFALVKVEAVLYDEAECPLCKENVPINDPGSRRLHSKS
jgi:orotate phosphoribosyltransferase